MFELICEYLHCRGKVSVCMGTCANEEEARRWVALRQGSGRRAGRLPADPHSRCPVACCALKGQPPRFGYRVKP